MKKRKHVVATGIFDTEKYEFYLLTTPVFIFICLTLGSAIARITKLL
jgi:hypothetical protein